MSKFRSMAYVGAVARAVRLATRPGGPSLGDRASAVPRMVRAVRDHEYPGLSAGRVALIAAGAAYVVSPVDLLPEGLLGVFGLADDAMVLGWVATALVEETERFIAWEHAQGRAPAGSTYTPPTDGPAASSTVPSDVVR